MVAYRSISSILANVETQLDIGVFLKVVICLNKFALNSLGNPRFENEPHYVRLTYQTYVRFGYLLSVDYSANSQNDRLINVNFNIAIDKFFTTEKDS